MMMLHDYVSKRWLYTGANDVMRLERDDGSVLGEEALALVMGKLSPNPSSHNFVTPLASCQPLCMDQAMRTLLLVMMPLMDNIGIALVQRGDQSRGIRIPGIGTAGGQGGAVSTPAPSKDKGKVVRVIHNDDDVSFDDDVPLQRRRRVTSHDGSAAGGPPLTATIPRPDSSVAVWVMASGRSSGNSATNDAAKATRATSEKEDADAATAKMAADDVGAVKKVVDDVALVKKAADAVAVVKKAANEAALVKKATDDVAAMKKAADDTTTVGSGSSPAPSAGAKRVAAPSGSTPLAKR
jgi:hypothetical protein